MAYDYSFKKFQHQPRINYPEDTFALGMNFTDSPLEPGQSKILVNYDIADDGTSLKPRAGIRLKDIALETYNKNPEVDHHSFVKMQLSYASGTLANQNRYVVGCNPDDKKVYLSNILEDLVHYQTGFVSAGYSTKYLGFGKVKEFENKKIHDLEISNRLSYYGLDRNGIKKVTVMPTPSEDFQYKIIWYIGNTTAEYTKNKFYRCMLPIYVDSEGNELPSNWEWIEINVNVSGISKQVGTVAWNDSYFFFGADSVNGSYSLKNIKTDDGGLNYYANTVTPTELTALEASPNKFNMLLPNPYEFANQIIAGTFVLQGILCYSGNNIVVSPRINTKYTYKLNYTAPANSEYKIVWEWKDYNASEFTKIQEQTVSTTTTAPNISCSFAAPIKESLMRVTVTGYTNGTPNTYPDQVLAIGISCDSETQKSTANSELKNYDLSTATGMCYWQNRLVLWGFEDPIIFVSETNLPEWFPYPNNTDLFDEPIVHCEPYLDYLLVFTTKKLYQLSLLSDGSGWTKTCLQDNLYITDFDATVIKTIKNMVFFKSGNSYYMVVPAASSVTTGGLTIAPIAKSIQSLLDNFSENVVNIIQNVYGYIDALTLIDYYNYVDYNDIVIHYVFETQKSFTDYPTVSTFGGEPPKTQLNFCLIYDTSARTWRIHIFSGASKYYMFRPNATASGMLMCATEISLDFLNPADGKTAPEDTLVFQTFEKNDNVPKDFFLPPQIHLRKDEDITNRVTNWFEENYTFRNYQYLDSGYRTLGYPNTKKRHREFQLRFNNKDEASLKFGFAFCIDGDMRRDMYKYAVEYNTNKDSDKYQTIDVVPKLEEQVFVEPTTILADTEAGFNSWVLNKSKMSEGPLIKARVCFISGKGYNSKVILLSTNETNYNLLGICWVYKLMNLR